MKLVVCGLIGDHLFSGDSIFPLAPIAEEQDDDAEAPPRESGVFARCVDLRLEAADDECELNLIDAEWDRLRAMPTLRRIGERRSLRGVG
jgi:hypothetical protein